MDAGEIDRFLADEAQFAIGCLRELGQVHAHRHAAVPVLGLVRIDPVGEHVVVLPVVHQHQLAAHLEQAVGVGGLGDHRIPVGVLDRLHLRVEELGGRVLLAIDLVGLVGVLEQRAVVQRELLRAAVRVGDRRHRGAVGVQHLGFGLRYRGGREGDRLEGGSGNVVVVVIVAGGERERDRGGERAQGQGMAGNVRHGVLVGNERRADSCRGMLQGCFGFVKGNAAVPTRRYVVPALRQP